MITGADLISLVLRDSGAFGTGQTPNGQDVLDAKQRFNFMVSAWSVKRWLTWCLVDNAHTCDGSISYTVGPGGNFNIPRPAQIKAAYVRQLIPSGNPYYVDFWLDPIFSMEDYSQITLKQLQAGPSTNFFYQSSVPLGRVYPWPLSNYQYELHILTAQPIPQVSDLSAVMIIPDEMQDAVYYNSLIRTRSAYDLPPKPVDVQLAKAALNTLRIANGSQVPSLRMPKSLRTPRAYNPYSNSP